MALLNIVDRGALFIQKIGRRINRQVGNDFAGIFLDRLFLDDPHHGEG